MGFGSGGFKGGKGDLDGDLQVRARLTARPQQLKLTVLVK